MDRRQLALEIHERLCREYRCPIDYFHALDPVSELVSSVLSHRTRNRDSAAAYRALKARYGDWGGLSDADPEEVIATIPMVTWPELKGPRIQEILRRVRQEVGSFDLEFLGEWPVEKARAWLERLPGVGPKTSAAVLSFSSLRGRALPVDSHHHRVAQRLGLIGPKTGLEAAHRELASLLPPEWDAQQVYDDHEVLMLHGQKVCHWREPACERCVLLDLCPTGQARVGQRSLALSGVGC